MADKKTQETVSEQLEKLDWRTTQREADKGYEHTATPGKWGAIISAIIKFQNKWNGQSPGNPYISKETGLTDGQVKYHLEAMEKRGLVIDRPGWPRRLAVQCSVKIADLEERASPPPATPKVEATVTDSNTVTMKHDRKKRESFMERAKKFAQALTDYYDQHGQGPMIKELAEACGYQPERCGALSRTAIEMVERGWLYHRLGCQRDFMLTGLGRAVLFGKVSEDIHTDVLVRPQVEKKEPLQFRQPFTVPLPLFRPQRVNDDMPIAEPAPEPQTTDREVPVVEWPLKKASHTFNLDEVDTVDLVLEVQARGFKVSR